MGHVDVELWSWPLGGTLPTSGPEDCLSPDETARANAFATPLLTSRWVRARSGMRRLLASRLGVRPEALVFQTGPHGKPFLTKIDCPFSFNLSHSDDLAVLAISDVDVGVDIERMGSLQEGVADIFFSSDENRMIAAMAPGERALAFYRCWTAKEAVLKALGAGLSLPGKSFTVGFGTDHTLRLLQAGWQKTGIDDWSLAGFDPMPGFAGAVAVRAGGGVRPILKQWDFGSV